MSFDWIKTIPDFKNYFNNDHQLIINEIGFDNYIVLFQYFSKTGIYFPLHQNNDDIEDDKQLVIKLIGEENYYKLNKLFNKTGIYFSSSPIITLKKVWANKNKHVDYKSAARILDTSIMSIYRWRSENCGVNE